MTLINAALQAALQATLEGPESNESQPATGGTPPAGVTNEPVAPTPAAPPAGTPPASSQEPLSLELPGEKAPAADATPVTYAPTGDVGLDVALDFIGNLGFGPEHAAVAAAQKGDFSLLEAALKSLGDKAKGYERILKLGKSSWESKGKAEAEAASKDREQILGIVGGEQAWTEIQTWARAQSTPAEAAAVNKALSAGGFVAKAVATALAQNYERSKAGTVDRGTPVAKNAARVPGGSDALDPASYSKEIATLTAKIGAHRVSTSPEYAALKARRAAFRG